MAEKHRELEEREDAVDKREAFFETDIELRLEKLERREQDLEEWTRRLEQKESELAAYVARAQTELHRRESLLRAPNA